MYRSVMFVPQHATMKYLTNCTSFFFGPFITTVFSLIAYDTNGSSRNSTEFNFLLRHSQIIYNYEPVCFSFPCLLCTDWPDHSMQTADAVRRYPTIACYQPCSFPGSWFRHGARIPHQTTNTARTFMYNTFPFFAT